MSDLTLRLRARFFLPRHRFVGLGRGRIDSLLRNVRAHVLQRIATRLKRLGLDVEPAPQAQEAT